MNAEECHRAGPMKIDEVKYIFNSQHNTDNRVMVVQYILYLHPDTRIDNQYIITRIYAI